MRSRQGGIVQEESGFDSSRCRECNLWPVGFVCRGGRCVFRLENIRAVWRKSVPRAGQSTPKDRREISWEDCIQIGGEGSL
jgi:hypothetical protein